MSPYAAFTDDVFHLLKPTEAQLADLAKGPSAPRRLLISDYPFASLEPLAVFRQLEILKLKDTKALRSLDGIEIHQKLKHFVIGPPYSWDSTKKNLDVPSFRPLQPLRALERLLFLRVRPADNDLSPLAAMPWLKELDLTCAPDFGIEQLARLSAQLPNTEGRCLRPYFEIPGIGLCKKCKGRMVLLTAPPPRVRWLCPACDKKRLDAHVARWDAALRLNR